MKITKAYAKEILEMNGNNTDFFNGRMTMGQFESMLRSTHPCFRGFTESEITTIAMAMVLAGAKFAD